MAAPSTDRQRLTIIDIIALDRVQEPGQDASAAHYRSRKRPVAMGNRGKIAYGGCATAFALHAAYQSLPAQSSARLYSLQGTYLGPTFLDRVMDARVTVVRQTRSFSTFLVVVSQKADPGKQGTGPATRDCVMMIADFMVELPNKTIFDYSVKPLRSDLSHHSTLEENETQLATWSRKDAAKIMRAVFQPMYDMVTGKAVPEGIMAQNANGYLTDAKTTQDDLPLTDKTSYDWMKARLPFSSQSVVTDENAYDACLFMFVMDGALSFLPLTHSNVWLGDPKRVEACSSLDFSLRFHLNRLAASSKTFLRELRTITGKHERTYTESRLFQEQDDGSLVLAATMTQQSILRGTAPQPSKEAKL